MNIDIKLHKSDLPEDLDLGNIIAVDGEFRVSMLSVILYVLFKYQLVILMLILSSLIEKNMMLQT